MPRSEYELLRPLLSRRAPRRWATATRMERRRPRTGAAATALRSTPALTRGIRTRRAAAGGPPPGNRRQREPRAHGVVGTAGRAAQAVASSTCAAGAGAGVLARAQQGRQGPGRLRGGEEAQAPKSVGLARTEAEQGEERARGGEKDPS